MDGFEFGGFPDETLGFLEDLKANNNREWFSENKKTYEQAVKNPAQQFCNNMCEALGALSDKPHKSKTFRINRDIRFSKDKTPYNAHLHIMFMPQTPGRLPAAWFFGLEPGKLTLGAGAFKFEGQTLDDYRRRVVNEDGEVLEKLVAGLQSGGARLNEPPLKRVPSGYSKDHPREALLRRKGLAFWLDMEDVSCVMNPGAVKNCIAEFRKLKPVFDWMIDG